MPTRLIVSPDNFSDTALTLSKDKQHYLTRVLRIKVGDKLEIVVEDDHVYSVDVTAIHTTSMSIQTQSKQHIPKKTSPFITLVQCLPKQDKLADILKQCTEVGVDHFIPVQSERSIPKLHNSDHKLARWHEALWSAAVQSQQYRVPTLSPPQSFTDFIQTTNFSLFDLCIVPWEEQNTLPFIKDLLQKTQNPQHILLFIGPEGGISPDEIEQLRNKGFNTVSLGDTILRVEHAGLYTAAMIYYEYH